MTTNLVDLSTLNALVRTRHLTKRTGVDVQSSFNEMLLEQLEVMKRQSQCVMIRDNRTPPDRPLANAYSVPSKDIPTPGALLARRNVLLQDKIGEGSYSTVHLAYRFVPNNLGRISTEAVAVKIVDRKKGKDIFQ